MEAEILQLKADIYNLKDVFRKYSMYGKFLAAISPEDWRKEQEALAAQTVTSIPPNIQVKKKICRCEYNNDTSESESSMRNLLTN